MTSYCKWSIVYLVFRRGKCCKGATPDFITKCDGLLLKSTTDNHVVTQIWLHACGYGKDVHGAVEFSCTLTTKGTERSNTLRLSYSSFTAM